MTVVSSADDLYGTVGTHLIVESTRVDELVVQTTDARWLSIGKHQIKIDDVSGLTMAFVS